MVLNKSNTSIYKFHGCVLINLDYKKNETEVKTKMNILNVL